MLADGLSTAYRWTKTEKSFIGIDTECLQWTYRGLRIIEEISRFDADIISIEECDQMPFLMKYLEPKGYGHYFQSKTKSPIRHVVTAMIEERGLEPDALSMPPDGVGIIYKMKRFQVLDKENVQYIASNANEHKVTALAVPLRVKSEENEPAHSEWKRPEEMLFVATHSKSSKNEKGEEILRNRLC